MFEKESNERLKWYFKRLGEVVNDTLAHSEEIQEILSEIKKFGVGVDLSMIIGLGLHSQTDKSQKVSEKDNIYKGKIRFELTSEDKTFLEQNKLRIEIDKGKEAF